MRVSVDRKKCCGYGSCIAVAPDLFAISEEDALAYPLLAEPGPEHGDALRQAVNECPANAIELTE